MKCCLCNKEIEKQIDPRDGKVFWDQGNNAEPLADGRCCGECNTMKVIPERLRRYRL
jgi:hypothetical protein